MTRDPCPYCGMQNVALARVDHKTEEIVRDIREHDCPAWAPKPVLDRTPTDTSFIREARNTPEGLVAWKRSMRKPGQPADATCGICRQRVAGGYEGWTRHLRACGPTAEVAR
jgi:hypothetical protein